jgi:CMP-N-acetylneuraminic acid synthetase|tara:strand:+ start:3863 stop:4534 length:672 start_codon:yes stop_codon:yes gene_type:complete
MKEICVIVQARLGSQRVNKKMCRSFGKSTLLDITLSNLQNSKVIHKEDIYVSVYEDELKNIAKKYDFNIYNRSEHSAKTENDMKLMFEWWNKLDYKYYIIISACHPFLSIETIDNFYNKFSEHQKKGLFAVVKKKNYYWDNSYNMITNWPENQTTFNTKMVENIYEAAHCLYGGEMNDIGKYIYMGNFGNKEVELFIIENEMETLDIDYEWQFKLYDNYIKYN